MGTTNGGRAMIIALKHLLAPRDALATSLLGSLLHARKGKLDLKVAATFGGAGTLGAFFGSRLTFLVSNGALLLSFASLMLVVAVMMIARKSRPETQEGESHPGRRRLWLTLLAGLVVGALTGFLGVGGGFLVVPALVLFEGLPMHLAVGTSLMVIASNSAAGFIGHLGTGILHQSLTLALTIAAVVGSLAGERFARRVPAQRLRRAFAYFVMLVAVFLLAVNCRVIF